MIPWRRLLSRARTPAIVVVLTLAVMGAGLLLLEGTARYVLGLKPENRRVLYRVHKEIKPGMTRQELQALLGEDRRDGLGYRWVGKENLSVWVHVGLGRTCYLGLVLADDQVEHGSIRSSEGGKCFADDPKDF